jgi:hypothetical protein
MSVSTSFYFTRYNSKNKTLVEITIKSNLPRQSPVLKGHLYLAVTCIKRSPLFSSHLYLAVTYIKRSSLFSSHLY